jgi:predicted DNA binding protein
MSAGLRVELAVPAAVQCPLAQTAAEEGVRTYSVSKSVDPELPERVTEEFAVESADGEPPAIEEKTATKVFERASKTVYRFERDGRQDCPCECVERHGLPVIEARAEGGTLSLIFHAPGQSALRAVIETVRDHYPQVEVRRLVQSGPDNQDDESLVFFDRSVFTERQQEVLQTAHEEGYFDHPKQANAGEVAEELGITTSTFVEHLSAAQRKLLGAILDGA